ncbi:RnfH family protein [Candidatus Persebacteraceae bacterium Df01]|uniref:RnfH family protein n=1 Tax=Candidatus Doriopsillibacter californiensis TaxID=2970740 RepID=A0ABT7QM03_9GAMM|nr:RnfH family protein [Candidatus Persebacteraceae bacterium Df01]
MSVAALIHNAMRRTLIVSYSAEQMFALVDDIESYPDFLPWCERAEVTRNGELVRAVLHIHYCGVKVFFATDNRHQRPSRIDMTLAEGPLNSLQGGWNFVNLGDGRSRVEFELEYEFKSGPLKKLFSRVLDAVFGRFVDSFIALAKERYGEAGRGNIRVAITNGGKERMLTLSGGATVGDALAADNCEEATSVGVFGRLCGRDERLEDGDRVEIYQSLVRDPRAARRKRAATHE